jgi:hypothetical protein
VTVAVGCQLGSHWGFPYHGQSHGIQPPGRGCGVIASGGEVIDESGIPVVEIPAEVLQRNERYLAGTEIVVRVLDFVLGRDSPDRASA